MQNLIKAAGKHNRALFRTVYFICYVTGLSAIKFAEYIAAWVNFILRHFHLLLRRGCTRLALQYQRLLQSAMKRTFFNLRNMSLVRREMRQKLSGHRSLPARQRLRIARPYLGVLVRLVARAFGSVFNYLAPVAAIFLLIGVVEHYTSQQYGLQVAYNGETLGLVENESVFEQAQAQVKERIISDDTELLNKRMVPDYTILPVEQLRYTSVDDLTDRLIQASGSQLAQASGLYISGRFAGATDNAEGVLRLLDSILQKYRTGDEQEEVTFIDSIRLSSGLYPVSSVIPLDQIEETLSSDVEGEKWYTVQPGDAPITIAQNHDMPYAQLKALNPDIEKRLLIGDQVLISQSKPFLGVQVERTITYDEEIPFSVERISNSKMAMGTTKTLQQGRNGNRRITARVIYVDGAETERIILNSIVTSEAVPQKIEVGTQAPLQSLPPAFSGSGSNVKFLWPVAGGYVSCGYGQYRGHTGMDIAAPYGTGVYASAAGTVVVARYYGPYGRYVIIDHGGGVQTLYAHNSALYVSVGQKVAQGQLIAGVGATGNATGNHCHFEIRIGGVYKNPAYYVSR